MVVDLPASRFLFKDKHYAVRVHRMKHHHPGSSGSWNYRIQPFLHQASAFSVKRTFVKECLFSPHSNNFLSYSLQERFQRYWGLGQSVL